MLDYKEIFIDSRGEPYQTSLLNKSELDFLSSKNLINIKNNFFKTNFVGEIITPENKYFSLPKNFEPTEENINLFKEVLNNYATINGKSILENNTWIISSDGKVESEKFYYNELKSYFLDYITYEFIYPKKRIKKHSGAPIPGGKIDVLQTIRNRKQKGPGITYNIKDFKNDNTWILDDIYWSTISYLADKYNDRSEIDDMYDFLTDEGFELRTIDISDNKKILKEIDKCDVGIIHNPIKETLISYFKSKSVDTAYKIKVFYTDNFAFVWEEMVRMSLKENKEFRNELKSKFERKESRRKWFPNLEEINKFIDDLNKHKKVANIRNKENLGTGIRLTYEIDTVSIPDLFSEYNDRRIIGDAKYYNDPEGSGYEKEFRTYNELSGNEYPMIILGPGRITRPLHVREEGDLELVIFQLSIKEVIDSAVSKNNNLINKIHMFLWSKGYTNR
jgi:hypothetical protein